MCSLYGASHSVNSGSCFSTSTTRSRTRCMEWWTNKSLPPRAPIVKYHRVRASFLSSVWQSKSTCNPPPPSPLDSSAIDSSTRKRGGKKEEASTNLHNWSLYFTSSLLATVLGSRKDPRPLIIPTTMPFSDGFKRWPQNTHTRACRLLATNTRTRSRTQ